MEYADKIVRKTLEIIEYLQPQKWWIENPRNGYLRTRGILDKYPYVDIDYCQVSDWGYHKPTRFWGTPNVVGRPNLRCDFQTCPHLIDGPTGHKRHRNRLGGLKMKFSTRMKGRIPEKAIEYLLAGSGGDTGKQEGASAEPGLAPHIISQEENKSEKERTKILGGEHAVGNSVCEVLVAPNLLQPPSFYVMECAKKKGGAQLLMRITAWLSNGEKKFGYFGRHRRGG